MTKARAKAAPKAAQQPAAAPSDPSAPQTEATSPSEALTAILDTIGAEFGKGTHTIGDYRVVIDSSLQLVSLSPR